MAEQSGREERINQRIFQRMDNSEYQYSSRVDPHWGYSAVYAFHPKHGHVGVMHWNNHDGDTSLLRIMPGHENLGVGLGMYAHALTMAARTNTAPPTHSDLMTDASIGVLKKVDPNHDFSDVENGGRRLEFNGERTTSAITRAAGADLMGTCSHCAGAGKIVKNYTAPTPELIPCPTCGGKVQEINE
jgi:hypothetical protein